MNNSTNKNTTVGKKKRGRFNFIDVTLIAILLLAIAALVYVFSPISTIRNMIISQDKTIEYTVLITNVEKESLEKIEEQITAIDSVSKGTLGTVVDKSSVQHVEYIPVRIEDDGKEDYVMKKVEYPDTYDVTVTIRASADYIKDQGYSVGATRVAVGEKIYLKFPNYVCNGYCESISVF